MVFWGTLATFNGWELIHAAEPLTLCVMVPSLLNGGTGLSPALYEIGHCLISLFGRLHPVIVCACERLMGSANM